MRIRHAYLWPGIVGIVLLLVAGAILSAFIAPNRYKGKIESAVMSATGRRLELTGDIAFGLTRWLSLSTGAGTWRSGAAPDAPPLAQWRSANLRVRLLPLLKGRLVLDTIRAEGLHLIVHRDAQGATNWQASAKPGTAAESRDWNRTLDIGGLDLKDASVDYVDDKTKLRLNVDSMSLTAGEWTTGAEVRVRAQLHARVGAAATSPSNSDLSTQLTLTSRFQADENFNAFALHASSLDARVQGRRIIAGGVAANLDLPRIAVVIDPLTIEVPTYTIQFDQARATGSLALERTPEGLHARGPLQLLAPSARHLMADLGVDAPLPRDPSLLEKLSLDGTWELTAGVLKVQPLSVQVDATRFDGALARSAGASPRLTFDLHADRMDLGAYADLRSAHPEPFQLPLAALRAFNAQGQIVFERARLADAQLKRVTLKLESHE